MKTRHIPASAVAYATYNLPLINRTIKKIFAFPEMPWILAVIICVVSIISGNAQPINYATGNAAYWTEKNNGFRSVTIGAAPTKTYSWDVTNNQYVSGTSILIPDLTSSNDGNYVANNNFYGFSGGSASRANFQWDNQTIPPGNRGAQYLSIWDVVPMFVSPVSTTGEITGQMRYCYVLQSGAAPCGSGNTVTINTPLVYSNYTPGAGVYAPYDGQGYIEQGDVDNDGAWGTDQVSQQSLEIISDCVVRYGKGWRVPTHTEMGHSSDGIVSTSFNSGYQGLAAGDYLWTSSSYRGGPGKNWGWDQNNGRYWAYSPNAYLRTRCVYDMYLGAPLPVELLSFTAQCSPAQLAMEQAGIKLNWATATEQNNDYFTVERTEGNNGIMEDWKIVGTVKGAGNSSTTLHYEFIDPSPLLPSPYGEGLGVGYYRLKQTDFNGQSKEYNPVSVTNCGAFNLISIYPNPATDYIQYLLGSEEGGEVTVTLYDALGREVFSKKETIGKGLNKERVGTQNFASGNYLLRITNGNKEKTQKQFVIK